MNLCDRVNAYVESGGFDEISLAESAQSWLAQVPTTGWRLAYSSDTETQSVARTAALSIFASFPCIGTGTRAGFEPLPSPNGTGVQRTRLRYRQTL
jgi:hypothetical protein